MRRFAHIFIRVRMSCRKILPFIISLAVVLAVTVALIVGVIAQGSSKFIFQTEYHFVCYTVRDNSLSADAISDTVSSYGGAGYVLEYKGEYYVTIACYYTKTEANRVRQNLLKRGLNCSVLSVKKDNYTIQSIGAQNAEKLYKGNLNTLYSLSQMCYECANGLDSGSYNQSLAKGVLKDVTSGLHGLKLANGENCFSGEIRRLLAECESVGNGYIYSKDMRKLQIAFADTIINIELY